MRYDELGNRMKSYEKVITNQSLIPRLPVYARIDGRAFHTFCKDLNKPFCEELVEVMQEVCKFLVQETNASLGYVQSDEISLAWMEPEIFEGKVFKLTSVLPSLASSKFVMYILNKAVEEGGVWTTLKNKCNLLVPSFDCRVFQLPSEKELANCFIWREIDASKNSVQMLGRSQFSHGELEGVSNKGIQSKLLEEKNINWNNLRVDLKRGAYFKKFQVETELSEEDRVKIPIEYRPAKGTKVLRSTTARYTLPKMTNVRNKEGVFFREEDPIVTGGEE